MGGWQDGWVITRIFDERLAGWLAYEQLRRWMVDGASNEPVSQRPQLAVSRVGQLTNIYMYLWSLHLSPRYTLYTQVPGTRFTPKSHTHFTPKSHAYTLHLSPLHTLHTRHGPHMLIVWSAHVSLGHGHFPLSDNVIFDLELDCSRPLCINSKFSRANPN